MDTQARSRPTLQLLWAERDQHPPCPRPASYPVSSSPALASLTAPSPMLPESSHAYDLAMRAHERTLLDRLDRFERTRRDSQHSPGPARSLSPISEQSLSARRTSVASLPLPRAPAPSPCSPSSAYAPYHRPQTLVDQTREMLLDGMPDQLPRLSPPDLDSWRLSLPSPLAARRSSQQVLEELQDWGHVYFGNTSIADCFVAAVALRRHSDSASADEGVSKGSSTPSDGRSRVTIRARIRPCALDRKPFLLRRTFDMDELRATVPDRLPSSLTPKQRLSSDDLNSHSPGRRRSVVVPGNRQAPDIDLSHMQSTNTVPIRESSPSSGQATKVEIWAANSATGCRSQVCPGFLPCPGGTPLLGPHPQG
jgi:hypothetical protein